MQMNSQRLMPTQGSGRSSWISHQQSYPLSPHHLADFILIAYHLVLILHQNTFNINMSQILTNLEGMICLIEDILIFGKT